MTTGRVRRPLLALVTAAVTVLSLAACGGTEESATDAADQSAASPTPPSSAAPSDPASDSASDSASDPAEAAPSAGEYVEWSDYEADPAAYADGKVVLFFHAPWCPSCRASEESINADGVPAGLTIVKVDYDSMTELKQKYGITVQHSFVQVDAEGGELKKWTGTISGADILAETV
ncbi:MAG: thioredoxin family protein [Nocardioides sp.]